MDFESLKFALGDIEESLETLAKHIPKERKKYSSKIGDIWQLKVIGELVSFEKEEFTECRTTLLEVPDTMPELTGLLCRFLIIEKVYYEDNDEHLTDLNIHCLDCFIIPYDEFLSIHKKSVDRINKLKSKN
jgi:hypothetical protein